MALLYEGRVLGIHPLVTPGRPLFVLINVHISGSVTGWLGVTPFEFHQVFGITKLVSLCCCAVSFAGSYVLVDL